MGCCASRSATVGVKETVKTHDGKDYIHATEAVGSSSIAKTSADRKDSFAPGDPINPNFTITPKYTIRVNGAPPPLYQERLPKAEEKSSLGVYPSASVYRQENSESMGLLSTGYTGTNSTDHLRASPYLSGLSNRKQYSSTEQETDRFTGFDAPTKNSDSEDGFDSDIEKENSVEKTRSRPSSPAEISLSSLLNKDRETTEYHEDETLHVHHPHSSNPKDENPAVETTSHQEILDASPVRETEKQPIATHYVETVVAHAPKASQRLGTPTTTNRTNSPRSQRKSPVLSRSGSPRSRHVPDPIMETLEDAFYRFARYGEVNSEGREMNNKNWAKLCRDCDFVDNKTILTGDIDVIFSRHKPKGQRLIDFDMFVNCLEEVADRKFKAIKDDRDRRRKVYENVIGKAPEYVGITGISRTGNVGRMTDHSLYPATHKMRFDEVGRGLGVEELLTYDPTEHGYVQGYKDKDTYDLKVSRPSSRTSIRPMSREASNISRSSPGMNRKG